MSKEGGARQDASTGKFFSDPPLAMRMLDKGMDAAAGKEISPERAKELRAAYAGDRRGNILGGVVSLVIGAALLSVRTALMYLYGKRRQ